MHRDEEPGDGFNMSMGHGEFELLVDGLHDNVRSIASGLSVVFGLDCFPSQHCSVGGWAELDGRAERIALVYGEFAGTGPLAVVHTTQGSAEFLVSGLRYGEGTLDPAYSLTPEDELPLLRRFEHFAAAPDLLLSVEGVELALHRRESGTAWYAWADCSSTGLGVVVEAAEIEAFEIRLGHVSDLKPYLDGHRSLLRYASGLA